MSGIKHKDNISFHRCIRNNFYSEGLIDPLSVGSPSFLSKIYDNSEKARSGFLIKTQPKWNTELVNQDTAEIYECSDLSSAVGRKYRMMDKFVSTYSGPYQRKEISLLFHTLTAVNMSNYQGIAPFLDNVKYRYEKIERPLLGYVWVLEVSKKLHVHYHLATAVKRIEVKRIPEELKFEGLWGARTGVEFVKGDVGSYMQKKALGGYMSKNAHLWERYQVRRGLSEADIKVMRMSGKSRTFSC